MISENEGRQIFHSFLPKISCSKQDTDRECVCRRLSFFHFPPKGEMQRIICNSKSGTLFFSFPSRKKDITISPFLSIPNAAPAKEKGWEICTESLEKIVIFKARSAKNSILSFAVTVFPPAGMPEKRQTQWRRRRAASRGMLRKRGA